VLPSFFFQQLKWIYLILLWSQQIHNSYVQVLENPIGLLAMLNRTYNICLLTGEDIQAA
jgi:hypothetical protein